MSCLLATSLLGFGGSRWTSPYFERYISLAVSTGVRLMLMPIYLMLGVFKTVSNNWIATMNGYTADEADHSVDFSNSNGRCFSLRLHRG